MIIKNIVDYFSKNEVGESIYINEGDILLFLRDDGTMYCYGCQLRRRDIFGYYKRTELKNKKECLEHLKKHIVAGHKVPESVINRLNMEIMEETV